MRTTLKQTQGTDFLTSPFGGEVDRLRSGEGACPKYRARKRPPHPSASPPTSPPKGEVPLHSFGTFLPSGGSEVAAPSSPRPSGERVRVRGAMLDYRACCSIAPLTRRYAPTAPLRGEVWLHSLTPCCHGHRTAPSPLRGGPGWGELSPGVERVAPLSRQLPPTLTLPSRGRGPIQFGARIGAANLFRVSGQPTKKH
jgi:hypothetical protein